MMSPKYSGTAMTVSHHQKMFVPGANPANFMKFSGHQMLISPPHSNKKYIKLN